ncbi:cyclic nucleotide-binding domain-containing protein [Halobacteriovorax sp. GB3]|uniref:cyclic nucleotide-gated ion channel n=1 Tax=Halobacteriovorax sp. GB3 TaxID=2719615 RepID=UPI0023628303|nr:cyclic nucleotide-gated ion channel [Halobacteriovorax sp. GB3]MDD0852900.1 cyclic nucleotide-binding domain-containing protein [Halobacteriovorax sp. GB3]
MGINCVFHNLGRMINQKKFSRAEIIWQGLIFWAITYTVIEAALSFTFEQRTEGWQLLSDLLISSFFAIDFIYQFRSKFKSPTPFKTKNEKIIWSMTMALELLAALPYDLIAMKMGLSHGYQFFYLLRFIRFVRIAKAFNLLGGIALIPKGVKFQFLIVMSMVAVHFISCMWVLIHPSQDTDNTTRYIEALYWTITTLTTIGYGDVTPVNNTGRLFTMAIMICGVGVYGVVIGNVAKMISDADRYKEKAREKMGDLNSLMKYYNVPDRVQGAVFNYYNHLLEKRLTDNDNRIISELPHALQQELMTYMNIKLIRTVPLFKSCSQACLKDVASALEQMYYSPGQTIINTGEIGHEMYIIGHGVAEVILKDGSVVANLHEGQFFGEIALLKETKRSANVRAQTYCDLYKLEKSDFLEIIKKHPELLERVEGIAQKRSSDRREKTPQQAA